MRKSRRRPCEKCGGPKPAGHGRQMCDACRDDGRRVSFWARVERAGDDDCWPFVGQVDPRGYGHVAFWGQRWLAHRLAYELTLGSCPPLLRHKCDNPPCCNPAHLEPGTQRDNVNDMIDRGRIVRGERSPKAKLTEAIVRDIKRSREAGEPVRSIAARWDISTFHIYDILSGRSWKHVA